MNDPDVFWASGADPVQAPGTPPSEWPEADISGQLLDGSLQAEAMAPVTAIDAHWHPDSFRLRDAGVTLQLLAKSWQSTVSLAIPCFCYPEKWPDTHPLELPQGSHTWCIGWHLTHTRAFNP